MGNYLSYHGPVKLQVPPKPSTLLLNSLETYQPSRPARRNQDTPLATVYRIYWAIVLDDTITLRNEIEYFWFRKGRAWKVENIPEPPDKEPERLAIISAIPYMLAAAFNRLIDLGLPRERATAVLSWDLLEKLRQEPRTHEMVPQWASDSPPLSAPLRLPTNGVELPEDVAVDDLDPFLKLKNVHACVCHIYFT